MTARRQFIQWIPLAGLALAAARGAQAAAPMVDPKDANAVALGYVTEAAKADKAKYKTYAAGQLCSNCQLFQGKAGDAAGGCPLFAGKQVAAGGWCSAYVKKA
ncbi:MAG TPA: high-potential iron-sulfur protein [Methylibium sp.]|nr:high-potential iron-sulfur protein [Methylibium sp.]